MTNLPTSAQQNAFFPYNKFQVNYIICQGKKKMEDFCIFIMLIKFHNKAVPIQISPES